MRKVTVKQWKQIKQHAALHLENPRWLGGAFWVSRSKRSRRAAEEQSGLDTELVRGTEE